MDISSSFEPVAILVGVLFVPAVIFFVVLTVMRARRNDFRRAREHKGETVRH